MPMLYWGKIIKPHIPYRGIHSVSLGVWRTLSSQISLSKSQEIDGIEHKHFLSATYLYLKIKMQEQVKEVELAFLDT